MISQINPPGYAKWWKAHPVTPKKRGHEGPIMLVNAVVKFYNYCIDKHDTVLDSTEQDHYYVATQDTGYVHLVDTHHNNLGVPVQLIGGGEHNNIVTHQYRCGNTNVTTPRDLLQDIVEHGYWKWPRTFSHLS